MPEPLETRLRGPSWGVFGTLAWTVLGLLLIFGVQQWVAMLVVAPIEAESPRAIQRQVMQAMPRIMCFSYLLIVPAIWLYLAVLCRARGLSPKRYLAIRPFSGRALAVFLPLTVVVYIGVIVLISTLVETGGGPASAQMMPMRGIEFSILDLLLLALGTIIGAPLAEEPLFRGFLLSGLARSRFLISTAVVLSALFFALAHAGQYPAVGLMAIFAGGIVFGLARLASGSVMLAVVLHAAWNLMALLIQALVLVDRASA